MPEVAEVAHVCALLRRNILGFRISRANLQNDPLLFPALKASSDPNAELAKLSNSLTNSVIDSVGRHGKYFWLRLKLANNTEGTTGVFLMHFGMTGMIKIKNVKSHLIFMENGGDKKVLAKLKEEATESKYFKKEEVIIEKEEINEDEDVEWPPRFTKMELQLEYQDRKLDFAFVDARRLGRVRLLIGDEYQTDESLLNQPPLNALGPDYSKPVKLDKNYKFTFGDPDPDNHGRPILSIEDFNQLILKKKAPIKSLLLDQAYFAGVGNWVGDEICYRARIHPTEIISNKVSNLNNNIDPVVKKLYESLIYVCQESVRVEGEVSQFPKDWLMIYRWGKSRKKGPKPTTYEGYALDHVTVGGRTSCFVPALQKPLKKRTIGEETGGESGEAAPKKRAKKGVKIE
ncbi:Formamidopyrimidine-DNA glycosylase N-terminal domain-containing protein [Scheffersomyces amazonensis]|uniref:Formamidopyrimidine-DNA glycosylase N-terminal domain-containing protein n=1 Tax=Scheffersomyces amazonensis TaxID=1078765 RepID=UPI00315C68D4